MSPTVRKTCIRPSRLAVFLLGFALLAGACGPGSSAPDGASPIAEPTPGQVGDDAGELAAATGIDLVAGDAELTGSASSAAPGPPIAQSPPAAAAEGEGTPTTGGPGPESTSAEPDTNPAGGSTAIPSSTTDDSPTTTSTGVEGATPPPNPGPGRRTTGSVIDPTASSVLFFSDNDDCSGIESGQRHPDWVAGQANSSRNADGTPTYGYAYNTGDATAGEIAWGFQRSDIALSGDCVLAMSVADAYENKRAVRIFRRYDRNGRVLPSEAYYSAWFYFPVDLSYDASATVGGERHFGNWNVFQLKNRVDGASLANLSVNAGKVTGRGAMGFSIWRKSDCDAAEECSEAATLRPHTEVPIPVGRWVHFELYVKASTGSDGRLRAWQDGREIISFDGRTERVGTDRRTWSVNNYGRLHRPSDHTLYVDDVLISTSPVYSSLFD